LYTKADRYGGAAAWGACIEAQDVSGRGALWGCEVDVMTGPDRGERNRWGLGVVLGRRGNTGPAAYVDRAIAVVPFGWAPGTVECGVGVSVEVPARNAAIAVLPGERIALDGERGEVTLRFDPATGFLQALFRGRPTAEVQMATGELRILGKTVRLI
jgi:hypothetical protein